MGEASDSERDEIHKRLSKSRKIKKPFGRHEHRRVDNINVRLTVHKAVIEAYIDADPKRRTQVLLNIKSAIPCTSAHNHYFPSLILVTDVLRHERTILPILLPALYSRLK